MQKKILVIDDEEILTRTFVRLLEKAGYEVFVAKSGRDAVDVAEAESLDLILCDIRMPGMDGIETIRKVRETIQKKGSVQPPEIFITGYADEKDEGRAKELQPAAYVRKPFDNAELLDRIKNILEHRL